MSGSEIIDEWKGKRVSVKLAGGHAMRGEVVRTDAVGVLLAVEEMVDSNSEGELGVVASYGHDAPRSYFVPWAAMEMLVPQ